MSEHVETLPWLNALLKSEALPLSFLEVVRNHYEPLAREVARWAENEKGMVVLGVNGAQGTGKSTMSRVLGGYLEGCHDLKTAILSIDDLYLTRASRAALAERVHPLLQTRGVPGTHDVELGLGVIRSLERGSAALLPRFDKSVDDRMPESRWEEAPSGCRVLIFEGWCVGAIPQSNELLRQPVNSLETVEDPDGTWRGFVNEQLACSYRELFGVLDRLVMLKAPSFECVHAWRGEQERKLRARVQADDGSTPEGVMDESALTRFIMHYERLTRWMLEEMPDRADRVLHLRDDHSISEARA